MDQLPWVRLERLRAPISLSRALEHLGIRRIDLIRREMRSSETREWIRLPIWLKENHPFIDLIEKNEIGQEILRKSHVELLDESHRLQDLVVKGNSLGLSEIVVPLVLRGERIGYVSVGGFSSEFPEPAEMLVSERLKVLMLSHEEQAEALKCWKAVPSFTPDKQAMVMQMVRLLGREVIQFFEETLAAHDREEAVERHTFNQLVTSNLALRQTLKKLPQIAASESPVLIEGEMGTGRELLAQMIHERSARKDKPFKMLHCASIAENLLEAELLGYEKGAIMGAYEPKSGLLEQAQGGTLFLREIGDLSLSMQHKILRIIQDKSFSRIGGQEIRKVDVRFIASTQRSIKKLVQIGAFREDLYFQLNVVELELPSLRQRKEDVPLLAQHFLKTFMLKMGKEGIQWREDALSRLSMHSFPGNVRELKNEVERLVALKDSYSYIEAVDLNPKIAESMSPVDEIERGRTLKDLVDEFERGIISEALARYHWNKSRVAELFQITRQGLLKKIAKYKLDKRKLSKDGL